MPIDFTTRSDVSRELSPAQRTADIVSLMNRSSIPPRRLGLPGPSSEDLMLMVAAASTAPSHGGLRNFRFVVIPTNARTTLADHFVKAEAETNPGASQDDLDRAREKAMHAPSLVLMIVRAFADHPDIPVIEQHVSAGAALGGFLHAAHGLGFGAMAVSGEKMRSLTLRNAFALESFEYALCFIAIGTPTAPARSKVRLEPAELVSTWVQG